MTEEAKRKDADQLQEIGRSAYESIAEMIAALECDWVRLEELNEERGAIETDAERAAWDEENGEVHAELRKAAGDECRSAEEARTRIEEDALSVQVRSGWVSPGEKMDPKEFEILLSTGGPATRIIGELDDSNEPFRARLEAQDWFLPWTEYRGAREETLLAYAQCFCFGE